MDSTHFKIGSKSKEVRRSHRVADSTSLSVRSKQLYALSFGLQKVIAFGKTLSSILTLKFNHPEFQSGIVWLHLLLRYRYFFPYTCSLLQAKERKLR
jgi:hypothetical protein